ncbi:hypothetical protein VSS74_18815 [Conexibacter stalactiti]|uniref:Uncharacterized protein n=1 Tax=Conexibacter stalactiti TaxID=1940611 RepID=A0ABU4HSW1_9ACTN|nr:hypothetical protein [Conexibacter stalactiti]MDW5596406.1 hypothetical protein [Conexibacter stalactiti]MEC5037048.1 hypothetical protein [Conexibacter stalactiti]
MALTCLAALVPAAAQACSCAPNRDLAAELAGGDPAVIGEVVARQVIARDGPSDPNVPSLDTSVAYTVRVERAFNGAFGPETTIVGRTNGGMCGFTWSVGQRVGAFVGRSGEAWGTSLCSLVDPAALIAAADTPPVQPPTQPPAPPTPPTPPVPPTGDGGDTAKPAPTLRARRGTHVAEGGPRTGTTLDRLPAAAGERVRLRLDAPARSVRFALARANGKRLGSLRAARAVTGSRRTAWNATLPRVLPPRADRLLVTVDYGAGKRSTFAVGLGRPVRAGAASALAVAGPLCPAALLAL